MIKLHVLLTLLILPIGFPIPDYDTVFLAGMSKYIYGDLVHVAINPRMYKFLLEYTLMECRVTAGKNPPRELLLPTREYCQNQESPGN